MIPEPTQTSELLRNILLGLSAFAAGLAAYLGWVNLLKIPHRRTSVFFVLAYWGSGGMAAIIAKLTFSTPTVAVTADAWAFAAFEFAFTVGIIGIAFMHRRRRKK